MLSNGIPPSVGTKMIRLLEPFMSCSTSIHCLVSASGDSVWFSSRCCSVCSRATSTRCRSVSICCSCAILLLIACTTWAGGCRSRRKNAVTVAIRNLPPPRRDVAEAVPKPHLSGVDHGHRRAEGQQDGQDTDDVAADAQQVGGRPGALRAHRGRGEK